MKIRQKITLRFTLFIGLILGLIFLTVYLYVDVKWIEDKYTIFIIIYLFSLIILYLVGRQFAYQILQPITKVMNQVEGITENNLHKRVHEGTGNDEIIRLVKMFNQMLERLEDAFKVQQTFIANASHEIRTPLAYISGEMEVTLMKERTKEEYTRVIQSVLDDIVKLGNTTNRLLLLTSTNADSNQIPMNTVRVDEVLWEAQSELNKDHPEYRIEIQFGDDFKEGSETELLLTTTGNDKLLRIVFLNLMENGCKYSDNHRVQVTLEQQGSQIQINFRDEGVGIPEEEQELIFEPFYRAKNSVSVQGSGLGLPLVKRITLLHSGSINVVSKPGNGSVFILQFPNLQVT